MWSNPWSLLLVPLIFYVFFSVTLSFFQSRLIYHPQKEITGTPHKIGMAFETISFVSSDNVKLSGWFVPVKNSQGVVLFCHGNAGNISGRLESIKVFARLGLSTFIFDYRGFGHSEGKPSEHGTYRDAEAAWDYLVEERQISPERIVIFGRSLGGAVAAWLGKQHAAKALIVESAFSSVTDIGRELYPLLPIKFLTRFDYNTIAYVKQAKSPLLIIHSPDDNLINFRHGQRIFEAAKEPKEFLRISGGHNNGFQWSANYEEGIKSFFAKY